MLILLTPRDHGAAGRIATLKSRHSGTEASFDSIVTLLDLLLKEDPKTKFMGYFQGGVLVSWMAVRFGTLGKDKVWVILGMYTSVFHNHFSWSHPELGQLVAWAFSYAESRGFGSYLYTVATRLERVYERQWQKNPWLPPRDRYIKEVVARVPADSLCDLQWVNRLANLPKPDDVSVLRRTLKEEYR